MSFDIESIHQKYKSKKMMPTELIKESFERIKKDENSWILKFQLDSVLSEAKEQDELLKGSQDFDLILKKYPLFGIPFGVKGFFIFLSKIKKIFKNF